MLRSRTISKIEILDIKWAESINSSAISTLDQGGRNLSFITTQDLSQIQNIHALNLGTIYYKISFKPLFTTIFVYYFGLCFILICVFVGRNLAQILRENQRENESVNLSARIHSFIGAFLGVLSAILSAFMLNDGHNWGGDFSQYLAQAIALARGEVARQIADNTYIIDNCGRLFGPYIYPWGLSLLLAPIYALFGFNVFAFKGVGVLCFGLLIFAFYKFALKFMPFKFALLATLLLALNPVLLGFQNNILSDVPFMLFSFLSVIFSVKFFEISAQISAKNVNLNSNLAKNSSQNSAQISAQIPANFTLFKYAFLCGIFTLFACLTRTNGFVLIIALFCFDFCLILSSKFAKFSLIKTLNFPIFKFDKTMILAHFVPFFISIFGVFLANHFLGSGGGSHLAEIAKISASSLKNNALYYLQIFGEFFPFSRELGYAFFILSLPLMCIGVAKMWRQNTIAALFAVLFVLGSLALYVLWPGLQGLRFVFSLLPFFVLFAILGLSQSAKFTRIFAQILLLIFVAYFVLMDFRNISHNFNAKFSAKSDKFGNAFSQEAMQSYEFIKTNTPQNAVVAFFKPRVLYLNTHRLSFATNVAADILEKAHFVLERKSETSIKGATNELKAQNKLRQIFENEVFVLYEIVKN